mmetsp:Transcript_46124/g.128145  ORF Transcript_46124/g.128145 Transcript_46124/m.128145 type:complete len:211 (-) Transcript_46124:231-863(-)
MSSSAWCGRHKAHTRTKADAAFRAPLAERSRPTPPASIAASRERVPPRPVQNLAANEIDRIENVKLLNSLETLQLEGNNISNLDEVQALSKLPCLRNLSLRLGDGELRNPVCEHPGYYTAVRRMLPKLQSLDGERTVLADASAAEENPFDSLSLPTPTPWLKDFSFDLDAPSKGGPLEGTQEFEQALTDCKRLSARAQSLIDDYKGQAKA